MEDFIRKMYGDFNARRMDDVLGAMKSDVVWANGMEGGYVHGREGVREYWTRQWGMVDPSVEPIHIAAGLPGQWIVEVDQTVRDLEGNEIVRKQVRHVFQIDRGLIARFDIAD